MSDVQWKTWSHKGAGHKMSPKKQRQCVFQAIGSESGKEGRKQEYVL